MSAARASLAALQREAAASPPTALAKLEQAAETAAEKIDLDEAATRQIIDRQLRDAGWEADTAAIRHAAGARPTKGRNLAIAEWPSADGRADYALFAGLTLVGVVEAKRKNRNVMGALDQAERYARGIEVAPNLLPAAAPWGGFQVPFVFSTNGRP